LYREFDTPDEFRDELRTDLTKWLIARVHPTQDPAVAMPAGQGVAVSSIEDRQLIERYFAWASAQHRHLEMTGFATRIRIPIELTKVVVPVRARLERAARATPRGRRGEDVEANLGGGDEGVVDFDAAWRRARDNNVPAVVVLGSPGSGKTTLLRGLLLRCIEAPEAIGTPAGSIPILLPLRLVKKGESLLAAIERIIELEKLKVPAQLIENALFDGRGLLLFDGLDEVASGARRAEVSRWIEEQARLFSKCPIVVTARFAGYVGDAVLDIPNLQLSLERFREKEIREFLERWFMSVETALGEDNDFYRERGRDLGAELAERVFETTEIYQLATNPLMLQIIALVHRDSGALPERRVELYEECVDVLLEYWDRAKRGIDLPFTAKEARSVLQPVAYWMHQKPDRRYASKRQLVPQIELELKRLRNSKLTASAFLDQVRDRSGLFVGYGTDEYGFPHLSFQEFLSAKEIRNRGAYGALVAKYGESWWREVTRLLVGLDDPSCFEPFVRELVGSPRFIGNHPLTSQCLADAFRPSVSPFEEALEASLRRADGREKGRRDESELQYHLLQAMTELPREVVADAIALVRAAREHAGDLQSQNQAAFLLAALGDTELPFEIDPDTGLALRKTGAHDGGDLLLVPGGTFQAGGERKRRVGSFYLARTPVTNQQYAMFLEANPGAAKPEHWDDERFNQPQQPVVGVSWHEAVAYAEWADLRLPTEWEWERAVRGTDGREYPWGVHAPDESHANFDGKVGRPSPVGTYPDGAGPYGHLDLAGNVWEWTDSWFDENERAKSLRGGSFINGAENLRASIRFRDFPGNRNYNVGFRCAQDP
jgi:formylglycine-generating enzyme required for sulfatase activity